MSDYHSEYTNELLEINNMLLRKVFEELTHLNELKAADHAFLMHLPKDMVPGEAENVMKNCLESKEAAAKRRNKLGET